MGHVSAVSGTTNPWQIGYKIPRERDIYLSKNVVAKVKAAVWRRMWMYVLLDL